MIDFSLDELVAGPARFRTPMKVRFQDVDAAGIVFYPRFFEYFHDAYVACLDDGGAPLARGIAEKAWAAPLRRVFAEYLRPLRFGDSFDAEIVGVKIDGTDVNVGYRVTRSNGEVVAVGTELHVFVDPLSFRRARVLPDAVRAAMAPLIILERAERARPRDA
jgi:YbgC/YbaW family acyl-CoA thioester hydrolase